MCIDADPARMYVAGLDPALEGGAVGRWCGGLGGLECPELSESACAAMANTCIKDSTLRAVFALSHSDNARESTSALAGLRASILLKC